jgi:hypothetical protein
MATRHPLDQLPPTLLLRVSVSLSGAAGFGVGLVLVWASAVGIAGVLPFEALAQAHGQVQALGFTGLFILGAAAQLLPGFLAHPLRKRGQFVLGGLLLAFALTLRIVAQPLDHSTARELPLLGFGILQAVGIGLVVLALVDLLQRTIQPPEHWSRLAMVGFGFLLVSTVLNLVASVWLAAGSPVVPDWLDAALIGAELSGFAVFMVFAVVRKILPRFLLLQPIQQRRLTLGIGCYLVGTVVTIVLFLLEAIVSSSWIHIALTVGAWLSLAGVALFLEGIRLYERSVRESLAAGVTEPARRWIRIAFGWLIVSNAIAAVLATRELLGGAPATYLEIAATRHALGQGFILIMIVALSARILPGVSAWAIEHPGLVDLTIILLTVGAILRVGGQLASRLGEPAIITAALGGSLGTLGFIAFALVVIATIGVGSRKGSPRGRGIGE